MNKMLFILTLALFFHGGVMPAYSADTWDPKEHLKPLSDGYFDQKDNRNKLTFIQYLLAVTTENHTHNMNGATGNVVMVKPDGKGLAELVFDDDGNRVDDCANMGSYNMFDYSKRPLMHFISDMLPWMMWGNCREDPTTAPQRVEAYLKDLKVGVSRIEEAGGYTPEIWKTLSEGQRNVVMFFIEVMDGSSGEALHRIYAQKAVKGASAERKDAAFSAFSDSFETVLNRCCL